MVEPKCPYFNNCGGCSTQHINYEIQLANKKELVDSAIQNSGITNQSKQIQIFSDNPYCYRNRMDFIFHPKGLGFRKKGKFYKIIDIGQCVISNDKLNALLKEVRDWFNQNRKHLDVFNTTKKPGTLRYAVIRATEFKDDSSISFVLI